MTARPRPTPGLARAVVVSAAVPCAALLVYQWAGGIPLWVDEEMLALNLRARSLAELAGPLSLAQAAPYGWLAAERLMLVAAGTSEQALRALPLLFGLGTLATAAWVGARWLGAWGGAALVLLCGFSPWLAYHAVEMKPYSADAFGALALPALAAWALEARGEPDARRDGRRVAAWWVVAAVSQWFAVAGLLVAPACALVLHAVLWRRHGWRRAALAGLAGLAFLASFGAHYAVSTRHALASGFLQSYWRFALPPPEAGVVETLRWLMSRLHPLAVKPIGTHHSLPLWIAAAGGVAVAARARPALAALLAGVLLSAFAWTGLGLVPMFERLTLWIVPAVFVAVGAAVAGLARLTRRALARRQRVTLLLAAAGLAVVAVPSADIARNGWAFLRSAPGDNNHDVNDRGGVRWLVRQARPGDVILTTHLSLPAVWWYGNLPVLSTAYEARRQGEAWPVYEAQPAGGYPRCEALAEQLGKPARVLVYLGFRFDDWPDGYDDVLFARLAEAGEVTAYRQFEGTSVAFVVDLGRPPAPGATRPGTGGPPPSTDGCVEARPARAW